MWKQTWQGGTRLLAPAIRKNGAHTISFGLESSEKYRQRVRTKYGHICRWLQYRQVNYSNSGFIWSFFFRGPSWSTCSTLRVIGLMLCFWGPAWQIHKFRKLASNPRGLCPYWFHESWLLHIEFHVPVVQNASTLVRYHTLGTCFLKNSHALNILG